MSDCPDLQKRISASAPLFAGDFDFVNTVWWLVVGGPEAHPCGGWVAVEKKTIYICPIGASFYQRTLKEKIYTET